MAEFKLVIGDPKTGKSIQKTVSDKAAKDLVGMKIGDVVKGEVLDMTGYEFLITGGSDYCGFPMRKGISGPRKKILATKGVGIKAGRKGMFKRKTVCGDSISEKITQVNLKVTKYGKKPLDAPAEEAAPAEDAPKEEAK